MVLIVKAEASNETSALIIRGWFWLALTNLLTRTMQIELDDFFVNVLDADTESVTKQAFFKARKNILPDAFKELFLMT